MDSDLELNSESDLQNLEYVFDLELTPNVYGIHENGKITIILQNMLTRTHKTTTSRVYKYLWHETMHHAMRLCLTEEEVKWAKQDRMIGIIELGITPKNDDS